MTPEKTELVERLRLLERIMTAAHDQIADRKMIVWKDDIQALDVAIKLIENMESA
jgi:prolyl-tRNA synthetase